MNLRTEQVILTDTPGNVLEYMIPKGIINIGSTCGAQQEHYHTNVIFIYGWKSCRGREVGRG